MKLINCGAFNELDAEIKQEFYDDVQAAIKDIYECSESLESHVDEAIIDRMFRALHTVKGNCKMVFLSELVHVSHKLEDLFSDIRSGKVLFEAVYARFSVVAINVIESQLIHVLENGTVDIQVLQQLEEVVDKIERASDDERKLITEKAMIAVQDEHFNIDIVAIDQVHGKAFSFLDATDMEFFQFIIDKQSLKDESFASTIKVGECLALKLNNKLSHAVDEQQIKAALIFILYSLKASSSRQLELDHLFVASGLLSRMSGWSQAAEICMQLLEQYNGDGVPLGLRDEDIMPVAQALALAIEFAFLVSENKSQGYKQSLFLAVKKVNALSGSQFKPRLIERFNQIIKQDYLTQKMW